MIHDVAIVGMGINGMSATYSLLKNNLSCICFEQNSISSNLASSQGPTRIIRKAYFEGADHYQKFINRGYELWEEIEKESNTKLFEKCGVLYIDIDKNGIIVNEIVKAQMKYDFDCKRISLPDLEKDQPIFKIKDRRSQAVLENDAGMIYADKALSSILNIINKKYSDKITIKDYTKIIDIAMSSKNNNYILKDSKGNIYEAKHLVIANGSWICDFFEKFPGLKEYRKNFRIENAQVNFFKVKEESLNSTLKRPFYIGREKYHIYGFPSINDGNYIKAGIYKYYEGDDSNFNNN